MRRRGAEEAGAIFVKLNRLDGTAELFGPAPQSAFDDARPSDRLFTRCLAEQPAPEVKIEERLVRELRFDPGCLDRGSRGSRRAPFPRSCRRLVACFQRSAAMLR